MSLLAMTFSLFLLIDPVGNIPFFISILKGIPPKRQIQIIFRELIIALFILIGFHFVGNILLEALQIAQYTVLISGGIILFLLSLKMIFPGANEFESGTKEKEPFIVPLAIPLVAGPAVLAAIILYSKQAGATWVPITAIILAWIISAAILLSSAFLNRVLGSRGIIACERLMGLILTMLAIQMFLKGIAQFIETI